MSWAVIIGIIVLVAFVAVCLIWQPTICYACDGAMINTGPGKVYCPHCNREGFV